MKNIRLVIISAFLFYLTSMITLYAEEIIRKQAISVLDFSSVNMPQIEVNAYTDFFTSILSENKNYEIINRDKRNTILTQKYISSDDCREPECLCTIGSAIKAEQIIWGGIYKTDNLYILYINLIDVNENIVKNSYQKRYNSLEKLINDTENSIYELIQGNTALKKKKLTDPEAEPEKISPIFNLFIPGYSQLSSGVPAWGTFYLVSSLIGAGVFAFSEYSFMEADSNYSNAEDADTAAFYFNNANVWRNLSIAGALLWGVSAITSFITGF